MMSRLRGGLLAVALVGSVDGLSAVAPAKSSLKVGAQGLDWANIGFEYRETDPTKYEYRDGAWDGGASSRRAGRDGARVDRGDGAALRPVTLRGAQGVCVRRRVRAPSGPTRTLGAWATARRGP